MVKQVKPRPDYEIYSDQLASLGYGSALWEPAPISGSYDKIEIGDVGYVRYGMFHLLFSAGKPLGPDQVPGVDVPHGFKPLEIGPVVNGQPRKPGALASASVRTAGMSFGASSGANIGAVSAGGKLSFESTTNEGAILITRYPTIRRYAQLLGSFKLYMKRHYRSWLQFANDKSHDLRVEDLRLVTGTDLTHDFSLLAFSHQHSNLNVAFEANALGASAAVAGWGSWKSDLPVYQNWGPQNVTMPLLKSDEQSTGLTENPDYTQCVFFRACSIQNRPIPVLPKAIKAAAGPDDIDGERDEDADNAVRTSLQSGEAPDGVFLHDDDGEGDNPDDAGLSTNASPSLSTPNFIHPLVAVSDFVFERLSADTVIVHDDDFGRLKAPPGNIPAAAGLSYSLAPDTSIVEEDGIAYFEFDSPRILPENLDHEDLDEVSLCPDTPRPGSPTPTDITSICTPSLVGSSVSSESEVTMPDPLHALNDFMISATRVGSPTPSEFEDPLPKFSKVALYSSTSMAQQQVPTPSDSEDMTPNASDNISYTATSTMHLEFPSTAKNENPAALALSMLRTLRASEHWRLQLNNLLQRSYGVYALQWRDHHHGLERNGVWESIAYIRGIEYGRGSGPRIGDAHEAAASIAYAQLYAQLYGRY